jgi:putative transposase
LGGGGVATGIRSRRQTDLALALRTKFNALKKKEQFPWVYEVTKCAARGAFIDVAAAFKNFFEGIKAGRKIGYPRIQE